jgi:hypothetical protein
MKPGRETCAPVEVPQRVPEIRKGLLRQVGSRFVIATEPAKIGVNALVGRRNKFRCGAEISRSRPLAKFFDGLAHAAHT